MAKYKYEVYEVDNTYSTETVKNENISITASSLYTLMDAYKLNAKTGNFNYIGGVLLKKFGGNYYKKNSNYYQISEITNNDTGGGFM